MCSQSELNRHVEAICGGNWRVFFSQAQFLSRRERLTRWLLNADAGGGRFRRLGSSLCWEYMAQIPAAMGTAVSSADSGKLNDIRRSNIKTWRRTATANCICVLCRARCSHNANYIPSSSLNIWWNSIAKVKTKTIVPVCNVTQKKKNVFDSARDWNAVDETRENCTGSAKDKGVTVWTLSHFFFLSFFFSSNGLPGKLSPISRNTAGYLQKASVVCDRDISGRAAPRCTLSLQ